MLHADYSLQQLADAIQATVTGDPDIRITGLASLEQASSGQVSFFYQPRYRQALKTTQAGGVIIKAEDAQDCPTNALLVENPYLSFARLGRLFDHTPRPQPAIHPQAVVGAACEVDPAAYIAAGVVIGERVKIAKGVIIQPGCVIGNDVVIDEGAYLHPNVTIYHEVSIGQRVMIHAGAVVGSDGFGNVPTEHGWEKIPHLGAVIIEEDAEIGANVTIDRGTLDNTIIGRNVKLDNLIHVGHNVKIGDCTAIAADVAIGGSTTIGKHCLIAGLSGIGSYLEIVDNVKITAMSMVTNSILTAGTYSSGTGLLPNKVWRRNVVRFRKLDALIREIKSKLLETT